MSERQKWYDWYMFSYLFMTLFGIYWVSSDIWLLGVPAILCIVATFYSFHKLMHSSSRSKA